MKSYNLDSQRVIIIPDIHQNVAWAKRKFAEHSYDHIVFLGDFFDSHFDPPRIYSVEETTRFIVEIIKGDYGPATLLMGNHDLVYAESYFYNKRNTTPKIRNFCSGFTNSKAKKINSILTWEHWRTFQLFTYCQGWLISHAGFRANFFMPYFSKEQNLERIFRKGEEAFELVAHESSPYFTAGFARGGTSPYGGPLWCDFQGEFQCVPDYRQIFGHTHLEAPQVAFLNDNGKQLIQSYDRFNGWNTHDEVGVCLDSTDYYGMLKGGKLEIFKL